MNPSLSENCSSLFLCYAPSDDSLARELTKHLQTTIDCKIDILHAGLIAPGSSRDVELTKLVDKSDMLIVFVSAELFALELLDTIVKRFKERTTSSNKIVPLLVRHVSWQDSEFGSLEPLPRSHKPVAQWQSRDEAWVEISKEIKSLIQGSIENSGSVRADESAHTTTKHSEPIPAIGDPSELNGLSHVQELEGLLLRRPNLPVDGVDGVSLNKRIDTIVDMLSRKQRPSAGSIVAGCQLIKVIGNGTFGTIWLAREIRTGHLKAVKIFSLEKLVQGEMLWRFRRGTRAMLHLKEHRDTPKSIVRISDVSPDTLAFTMDYYENGDLEEIAAKNWNLEKKVEILLEICRAVDFAHKIGIIHRDIKPANVLLNRQHMPVLTDFDLADIRFVTRLSTSGVGFGTPVFAAPEQLEDANHATERSDIYSLGRLLYFLLLERSPGIESERDPVLDNLGAYPSSLVAIIRKATQRDPQKRFRSVDEMIYELLNYRSGMAAWRARYHNSIRMAKSHSSLLTFLSILFVSVGTFGVYQSHVADVEERARIKSDLMRTAVEETLAQLVQWEQKFKELRASKETNREEISRLEAELLILDIQSKNPITSLVQLHDLETKRSRLRVELEKYKKRQEHLDRTLTDTQMELEKAKAKAHQILRNQELSNKTNIAQAKIELPSELGEGSMPLVDVGPAIFVNVEIASDLPDVPFSLDGDVVGILPYNGRVSTGKHTFSFQPALPQKKVRFEYVVVNEGIRMRVDFERNIVAVNGNLIRMSGE